MYKTEKEEHTHQHKCEWEYKGEKTNSKWVK